MKVSQIVKAMDAMAPPELAAEWDNVGLLVGDASAEAQTLLLCIYLTQQTLDEARRLGAGMVMAYHPVIFKPVGRMTADAAPIVFQAARDGIAVYSTHTALDAAVGGTNDVLADVLGLADRRPLEPALGGADQCKVVVFVQPDDLTAVADAAFAAGAGRIGGYSECAFFCHGIGSFLGQEGTHPTVGQAGQHEATEELRLEMIAPRHSAAAVAEAIREAHSYEEPAIDVYPLEALRPGAGIGRVGRLERPAPVRTLTNRIKRATGLKRVLLAAGAGAAEPADGDEPEMVSVAACCAGSCGSAFESAVAAGASFYLTGEMRHHDALAATAAGMTVVCLGHSNSERMTLQHVASRLTEQLPELNAAVSETDRDPFEIV